MANEFTVPLAPWIKSAADDSTRMYAEGAALGARAAMERARLQEAAMQNQAEMAMRSQQIALDAKLQRERVDAAERRAQQESLMEQAYREATIGLKDRQLADVEAEAKRKAAIEARQWAAREGVGRAMQSGVPLEEAIYQNPDMLSPGVMEAMVRRSGAQKEYGEPTAMEIPGVGTAVYRKGSTGLHFVPERKPDFTPMQRVTLQEKLANAKATLGDFQPGSEEHNARLAQIKAIEEALGGLGRNPASDVPIPPTTSGTGTTPAPKLPWKEGDILRNKKNNSRWIVRNGKLEPYVESNTIIPGER